jgi:hypothetical protein
VSLAFDSAVTLQNSEFTDEERFLDRVRHGHGLVQAAQIGGQVIARAQRAYSWETDCPRPAPRRIASLVSFFQPLFHGLMPGGSAWECISTGNDAVCVDLPDFHREFPKRETQGCMVKIIFSAALRRRAERRDYGGRCSAALGRSRRQVVFVARIPSPRWR